MKEQIPFSKLRGGGNIIRSAYGNDDGNSHHKIDKSINYWSLKDRRNTRNLLIKHHDGTTTTIEAPQKITQKEGSIKKRFRDIKANFWSNLFTNLIQLMCIIGFSMITNVLISKFLYNDYSDSNWPEPPDEDNPEGFIAYVKRKYWFNSAFLNTISLIITTLYVKFFLWLLTRKNEDKRLSQKLQFGLGMIYTLVLIGYVYYKHR